MIKRVFRMIKESILYQYDSISLSIYAPSNTVSKYVTQKNYKNAEQPTNPKL